MILSVHQPQYLPWLGYFDKIIKSDCFVFLDNVQYKHREYQNRNKIRTSAGWIWLTVPVITKGLREQAIGRVRIDNTANWRQKHYKSIKTSYANANFFDNYAGFFEEIYLNREWEKLSDLNVFIINRVIEELKISRRIYFESELGTTQSSTRRIAELCVKLGADTYLSGAGGRDYLDEKIFNEAGIKLIYQDFKHPFYSQNFAKDKESFIPYMSVIDLLLNEGPGAAGVLGL